MAGRWRFRSDSDPSEARAGLRFVFLTDAVPLTDAGNAGQNFVGQQVAALEVSSRVEAIVVPGRSASRELSRSLCRTHVLQTPAGKVWNIVSRPARLAKQLAPSMAEPAVTAGLLTDSQARHSLRHADVLLAQWQYLAAAPILLKGLGPRALLVSVLHDVMSQSHERYAKAAPTWRRRARYRMAAALARLVERHICRWSDRVVVLSDKDAALLPQRYRAKVRVVPAPVVGPAHPERRPVPGRVVLVSSWRYENVQGLDWFTREVLPTVRDAVPELEVQLVGRMEEPLQARLREKGYVVRGFVDDLSELYAEASLAAVPLFLGAGVKFKTIEAILHGVPVVATTVGAEGIAALAGNDAVTDEPDRFAAAMIHRLRDPVAAAAEVESLRGKVAVDHSADAFRHALWRAVSPV